VPPVSADDRVADTARAGRKEKRGVAQTAIAEVQSGSLIAECGCIRREDYIAPVAAHGVTRLLRWTVRGYGRVE
jgi:hypothetical protein